ncbi:MAG TPA: hypothetical protein ENK18_16565 [Deltaproteobacteria bacterium]|nr:hypothetical protein [Deltaproteobacteria bacterium]
MRQLVALLVVGACAGDKDTTSIVPDTGAAALPTGDTAPPDPPGPDLVVTDAHNYSYSATWSLPVRGVRARQDIVIDWSGLDVDAWGSPRQPSTYERMVVLELGWLPTDVEIALAIDDLHGPETVSSWTAELSGGVFADLSEASGGGYPLEPANLLLEQQGKSWFVGIGMADGDRIDVRAGVVLLPDDQGTELRAEISTGDGSASYVGSFSDTVLQTSEIHELFTADWRGLSTSAYGTPYDRFLADELFIGHWADGTPPEALAGQLLELRSTASGWWTLDVGGAQSARLEIARDAQGNNFPGFTAGGTWVLGVRCRTCLGPVPQWMSVVEVL